MKMKIIIFIVFITGITSAKAQFFTTPKGQKYHRGDCKLVERNAYELGEMEAIQKKKKPCKICCPARFGSGGGIREDEPVGVCPKVQCNGTTKKGTRCKHKTTICNGLCYEHGKG